MAKGHGRQNQTEVARERAKGGGSWLKTFISGTGSVIEVVNVLGEAGTEVLCVLLVYLHTNEKSVERLQRLWLKISLLQILILLQRLAAEEGCI